MAKALQVAGVVATVVGFIFPAVGVAAKLVGAILYMGGVALETKQNAKNSLDSINFTHTSPTYKFGVLETTANNTLIRPMIYGENKVAGNLVWHSGGDSETIKKIIAYGDGEIQGFSDIQFNNIAVGELSGCSYSAYTGTGTQLIDSRVPGSSQGEKAQKTGGLKYDAYLAVTATAQDRLSDSYFSVTALVQGRKIRVYTDTETYTTVYSTNPAWCILDFLTAYNGCQEDISKIDIQSFINAAEYCDEDVDGQPRFTLNLVCDCKKSYLDWLHEMLVCCRGFTVYQNGKLYLNIEQAGESQQSFDEDNIIAGSEKFWTIASKDRYDVTKIRFIDPENEYARIFAVAEAEEFNHNSPVICELEAFGVNNFKQASRLAWFYENQAKTCDKLVSFQTTKEGLDRTVGDIIDITSTFLGYVSKKMRVIQMTEPQDGQIELYCKEYNENLYSDAQGSVEPVIDTIILPNILDKPPVVSGLAVSEVGWRNRDGVHISNLDISWNAPVGTLKYSYLISYSTDGGSTYTQAGTSTDTSFRLEGVKPEQAYKISIQASNTGGVVSDRTTSNFTPVGKDDLPPDVENFVLTLDKLDSTKLKFSWTRADIIDLRGYEIREGLTWESGTTISSVLYDTEKAEYEMTESRDYNFWLKAVDNSYNYSETPALISYTGNIYPENITNFQAIQNGEYAALSWNAVGNSDLYGYEIRMGMGFDGGSLVISGIKNNFYQVKVGQEKIYYFTIKAVNNAGNYSQSAAFANIDISNLPNKNVIETYDELSLQSGSHDDTSFDNNTVTWDTLGKTWDEYTTETWDSFGGASVLRLGTSGGMFTDEDGNIFIDEDESGYYIQEEGAGGGAMPESGVYTCEAKDMGQVITCNVSADFITTVGIDSEISAKLQFRLSNDNTTWSDWKDFTDAEMTFRYLQTRIVMTTSNAAKTPYVTVFTLYVDVPDVIKSGTAVIPVGGGTFEYGHTYYEKPVLVITALGANIADYDSSDIDYSEGGCVVRNLSGTDVGGTVHWQSIGY